MILCPTDCHAAQTPRQKLAITSTASQRPPSRTMRHADEWTPTTLNLLWTNSSGKTRLDQWSDWLRQPQQLRDMSRDLAELTRTALQFAAPDNVFIDRIRALMEDTRDFHERVRLESETWENGAPEEYTNEMGQLTVSYNQECSYILKRPVSAGKRVPRSPRSPSTPASELFSPAGGSPQPAYPVEEEAKAKGEDTPKSEPSRYYRRIADKKPPAEPETTGTTEDEPKKNCDTCNTV